MACTYTYDLLTDIRKLRREAFDIATSTDPTPVGFTYCDEELQYFLDKANGDIQWAKVFTWENRAAIDANLTGRKIEVGDIKVEGTAAAGINWWNMAQQAREHLESGLGKESTFNPFYYSGGVYKSDRDQLEDNIRDGIFTGRDFYNDYNESGKRGGLIGENDTDNCWSKN